MDMWPHNVALRMTTQLCSYWCCCDFCCAGALDPSHVRHELAEFGVATTRLFGDANLNVDDFKSLAVVWLKKILDTHAGR